MCDGGTYIYHLEMSFIMLRHEAKFQRTGEICLSMMLAHRMMGEICSNSKYGYFVIRRNFSLFEPRFFEMGEIYPFVHPS